MDFLLSSLGLIIGLVLIMIILLALLAPFEAMGWWAGWSRRDIQLEPQSQAGLDEPSNVDTRSDPEQPARHYVVYLTGILGFSGELLGRREISLMEKIAERLSGDEVMIGDVFPYSINNNPLNGERAFKKTWQWLKDRQKGMSSPVNVYNLVIILRNLFQVAVSADRRYGPLNNFGVAREIVRSLYAHGYPPGSQKPVILVGYSGGGQISVGAAPFLQQALAAPVVVIGLGGVMMGDPGINAVTHLYNLRGSKDFFPWIGVILSPGRWPFHAFRRLEPGAARRAAQRNSRRIHVPFRAHRLFLSIQPASRRTQSCRIHRRPGGRGHSKYPLFRLTSGFREIAQGSIKMGAMMRIIVGVSGASGVHPGRSPAAGIRPFFRSGNSPGGDQQRPAHPEDRD